MLERLVKAPSGSFAALMYHRVDERAARPWLYPALLSATPSDFERQMQALVSHSQPMALNDLLAAQRGESRLPARAVLLTFDDAYRDFAENAWPVLKRLRIPVTLFVPTGYPDATGRAFWWDRLWQAVTQSTNGSQLQTALGLMPMRNQDERWWTARSLIEIHKRLPHEEAMGSVAALCEQLGADAPSSEVLSWDELRALAADGVDIAAHSRNHPLLTQVPSDEILEELAGSRTDLEARLPGQAHASVLAYPGGRYDERVTSALAELGFHLAFTTERGLNRVGHTDRFRLRRINAGTLADEHVVRAQLAMSTLRCRTFGR
ncbi:MAG TPA: polysaccharide deacetylase family protein [Candidatus Limnocylindria bacterium]|nr:polysaccharide deacetylase family protein [Candidatus Limnocylindria bacterium]